jgi:hypothetical protein
LSGKREVPAAGETRAQDPRTPCTAGLKLDAEKPRLSLIPGAALVEIALVLEYGARKYAVGNWRHVRPTRRYLDAALRHLHAAADGEETDPESGLSHLAHAACSLAFLLAFRAAGVALEDAA